MTIRTILDNCREWLFRGAAMRVARAELGSPDDAQARGARQAKLLLEVAHRVAEPVERLPAGSRAAVLLVLCRDAVYWALSGRAAPRAAPPDLRTLWEESPPDELLRAAHDQANLAAVKATLVDLSPARALAASEADAARARAFAEALLSKMDAPQRQVDRIRLQRWSRVLLAGAALLLLGSGLQKLTQGPNLAAGKPFRTSSSWSGCSSDPGCQAQMFHTDPENNPWVEIDLQAPKTIHRIEVTNRDDCCAERAIPLVAEISLDRVSWTQVGRRDKEFSTWTAKFPARRARYVKLRIDGASTFHLKEIAVR